MTTTYGVILSHAAHVQCSVGNEILQNCLDGYGFGYQLVSPRGGCMCHRFLLLITELELTQVLQHVHPETMCKVRIFQSLEELQEGLFFH